MSNAPDQSALELYLRAILESLPDPAPTYCLIGALALGAWGRIRSTKDIDLLTVAHESQRSQLTALLTRREFRADQNWANLNPFAADRVIRFLHPRFPGIPLDILLTADAHEEITLTRRQPLEILGTRTWVCGPEDLILMNPHDFEDVLSIVSNPGLTLDLDYLWSWAERLGLQSELHYVLISAKRE